MQEDRRSGARDRQDRFERLLAWFYRLLPVGALGVIAVLAIWLTVRFALRDQYGWSIAALSLLVFTLLVIAFMRIGEASKIELALGAIGKVLVEYHTRTEVEARLEAKFEELSKHASSEQARKALEEFKPALVRETTDAVTRSLETYWATVQEAVRTPSLTSVSSGGFVETLTHAMLREWAIRRRMPGYYSGQALETGSNRPIGVEGRNATDQSSRQAWKPGDPPPG